MTTPDDDTGPAKSHCAYCLVRQHMRCRWLIDDVDCGCACPWLQADMAESFPSLRRQLIEETPMTQPIDDNEYAEDAATVPTDDLPEPTDPSQVPPDEGDAGAVK